MIKHTDETLQSALLLRCYRDITQDDTSRMSFSNLVQAQKTAVKFLANYYKNLDLYEIDPRIAIKILRIAVSKNKLINEVKQDSTIKEILTVTKQ